MNEAALDAFIEKKFGFIRKMMWLRFKEQKAQAKQRGIPFLFTFDEWRGYWLASGHVRERGVRRGQYVMSRPGDKGPYDVGNVSIIKVEQNSREAGLGNTHALGYRHTAATRRRLSASHVGKKHTAEERAKIRAKNLGR